MHHPHSDIPRIMYDENICQSPKISAYQMHQRYQRSHACKLITFATHVKGCHCYSKPRARVRGYAVYIIFYYFLLQKSPTLPNVSRRVRTPLGMLWKRGKRDSLGTLVELVITILTLVTVVSLLYVKCSEWIVGH